MNEVAVFKNEQFGEVRTVIVDGEPWFVAADVCKALEIRNNRDALSRLDEDEKGVALTDTLGGLQEMTIVNEPGLYSIVLGSRKPEAKAFKRWLTHEVIPSIRKTGAYSISIPSGNRDKFEMALLAVKATADLINAGEAGRLMMMEKLCTSEGVNTAFIPEYGSNGNHLQMSLTDLLKKNNCSVKAGAFNKLLIAEGYLEEQERQSSKRDDEGNPIMKKFKVLTEKGTRYGVNMVSRHNQRETQPLYFDDTFMELYNAVMGE